MSGPDSGVPDGVPGRAAESDAPGPPSVVKPPALVTRAEIPYPDDAYSIDVYAGGMPARIRISVAQGRVMLRILVRADGSVARVEIAESSGVSSLDVAAIRAATGWTFVPATRDGEPIDAWALIAVRFTVP